MNLLFICTHNRCRSILCEAITNSFNIDIAITVCDSAAGESCPLWLGNAPKVHWGLTDPSKLSGSDAEIEAAFNDCIASIQARIKALLALDLEQLSKTELIASLKQIHTNASEGSLI